MLVITRGYPHSSDGYELPQSLTGDPWKLKRYHEAGKPQTLKWLASMCIEVVTLGAVFHGISHQVWTMPAGFGAEFSETEAFNWRLQQLTSLNLPGDTCRKYSTASSAVLLSHVKVPFFGTWMRAMAGVAIGGFNML